MTLAALLAFAAPARAEPCRPGARPMAKVELFLGAVGPAAAWRRFLAEVVTPRFPDGLTVLEGSGQWRGPHGFVREPTRILVVFYAPDATSDVRIEAIRRLYSRRFAQRSVLRADSSACVGF